MAYLYPAIYAVIFVASAMIALWLLYAAPIGPKRTYGLISPVLAFVAATFILGKSVVSPFYGPDATALGPPANEWIPVLVGIAGVLLGVVGSVLFTASSTFNWRGF